MVLKLLRHLRPSDASVGVVLRGFKVILDDRAAGEVWHWKKRIDKG